MVLMHDMIFNLLLIYISKERTHQLNKYIIMKTSKFTNSKIFLKNMLLANKIESEDSEGRIYLIRRGYNTRRRIQNSIQN